jgi:hypothetical protein
MVDTALANAVTGIVVDCLVDYGRIRNIVRIGVVTKARQPVFQPPLQRELERIVARDPLVNLGRNIHARQTGDRIGPTIRDWDGELVDIHLRCKPTPELANISHCGYVSGEIFLQLQAELLQVAGFLIEQSRPNAVVLCGVGCQRDVEGWNRETGTYEKSILGWSCERA